ncbi:Aste57867_10979 [Aphanomyces stellatus]|uniref:Aste57867_10979 protein n=1 Tax=Aphanomyces stellatus TaxID=120398 RepID=A0A485KSA6_9STRA|nr:hypothetical protein As57867_010938 [Aphanomyces stellatus]VFT87847.1 Aste57867_10979 [Aphanomyces stellatus]
MASPLLVVIIHNAQLVSGPRRRTQVVLTTSDGTPLAKTPVCCPNTASPDWGNAVFLLALPPHIPCIRFTLVHAHFFVPVVVGHFNINTTKVLATMRAPLPYSCPLRSGAARLRVSVGAHVGYDVPPTLAPATGCAACLRPYTGGRRRLCPLCHQRLCKRCLAPQWTPGITYDPPCGHVFCSPPLPLTLAAAATERPRASSSVGDAVASYFQWFGSHRGASTSTTWTATTTT